VVVTGRTSRKREDLNRRDVSTHVIRLLSCDEG